MKNWEMSDEEWDSLTKDQQGEWIEYWSNMDKCHYCGGECPNEENNACDGYLGDIDNLYDEYGEYYE